MASRSAFLVPQAAPAAGWWFRYQATAVAGTVLVGAGRYPPPPPLFPLLLRQPATATLSTRTSRTAVTISRIRLMAHLLVPVSPPLISEKPGAPPTIAGSSVRRGPISSGARGAQLLGHVSRTLGRPPEIPARDPSPGERGLLRDVFQGRRGGAVPGLIADCRWEQRQREREGTALTQGALDPDPPAVLLDDAAANGQTKAAAALVARIGRIDLLEAPENGLQLVGRDAPTLILDANQHLAAPRFGGNPDGGVRR